jgi:hypothetical protein
MTDVPLPAPGDTDWNDWGADEEERSDLATVTKVRQNGDGTWPNRPTSSTDFLCLWVKTVAGSSDPASATSPAVTGAYAGDFVMGV